MLFAGGNVTVGKAFELSFNIAIASSLVFVDVGGIRARIKTIPPTGK